MPPAPEPRKKNWRRWFVGRKYDELYKLFVAQREGLSKCNEHKAELQREIDDAAVRLNNCHQDVAALRGQIDDFEAAQHPSKDLVNDLMNAQDTLRADLQGLEERNTMLEARNALLEQQLVDSEQQKSSMGSGKSGAITTTRRDNDPNDVSTRTGGTSREERLYDELVDMGRRLSISDEKLQRCWAERNKMHDKLEEAKETNSSAESEVIKLQRERAQLKRDKAELKDKLCRLGKVLKMGSPDVLVVLKEVMEGVECTDSK
jgi:chromosome segregation ATPase